MKLYPYVFQHGKVFEMENFSVTKEDTFFLCQINFKPGREEDVGVTKMISPNILVTRATITR